MLDSNLVNYTDLTLLRFIYFTLTALKLQSCSSGIPRIVSPCWIPFVQHLGLLVCLLPLRWPEYYLNVIVFATFPHFFPYTGHHWVRCPVPQYLQLSLCGAQHKHFCVFCWMASKSLYFLMLFSTLVCALCASILHAQINTFSHVASSIFSWVVTSL